MTRLSLARHAAARARISAALCLLAAATIVSTIVSTFAAPLAAQPSLPRGTRVRVHAADTLLGPAVAGAPGDWRVGTVVASTPATLVFAPAPPASSGPSVAPIALSLADVRSIDVSLGRPDRRWTGAAIGGALSGAAFVALACAFSDGSCSVGDNVGGFVLYYATGAVPGAIVGGVVGGRHHGPERWRQVWSAPALDVGLRIGLPR